MKIGGGNHLSKSADWGNARVQSVSFHDFERELGITRDALAIEVVDHGDTKEALADNEEALNAFKRKDMRTTEALSHSPVVSTIVHRDSGGERWRGIRQSSPTLWKFLALMIDLTEEDVNREREIESKKWGGPFIFMKYLLRAVTLSVASTLGGTLGRVIGCAMEGGCEDGTDVFNMGWALVPVVLMMGLFGVASQMLTKTLIDKAYRGVGQCFDAATSCVKQSKCLLYGLGTALYGGIMAGFSSLGYFAERWGEGSVWSEQHNGQWIGAAVGLVVGTALAGLSIYKSSTCRGGGDYEVRRADSRNESRAINRIPPLDLRREVSTESRLESSPGCWERYCCSRRQASRESLEMPVI